MRALGTLLLVIIIVAVGVVAAYVLSPNMTVHNECGVNVPLPGDIPLVGRELKPGDTTFKVPPGNYVLTRDGLSVRVQGPLWIDFTVPAPQIGISVTIDGRTLDLSSQSQQVGIGPGSNAAITLCSAP